MALVEVDSPRAAELRRQLVRQMVTTGSIQSPAWQEAFEEVHRHVFAPVVYQRTQAGRVLLDGRNPADREAWLTAVYSDDSLVTRFDGGGIAMSSSTQPSLMALMLEALDVKDGHRVLEIGTGTGFNAALLSRRLGSNLVTSVEIDPQLVAEARRTLAACGYHPTVVAADGLEGYQPHAPYDRIIATCSVRRIPVAWLAQTGPGGLIVANIGFGVVPLRVEAHGSAQGRFLSSVAAFIEARPADAPRTLGKDETISLADGEGDSRPVSIPREIDDEEFSFFLRLTTPGLSRVLGILNDEAGERCHWLANPDTRSWARATVRDGQGSVTQGGSRRLWDELEKAHACWGDAGRPVHDRLGLAVTLDGQHQLWVDTPQNVVAML